MSSSSEDLPRATGWRSVTSSTFAGLGGLLAALAFSARFCCILRPAPPLRAACMRGAHHSIAIFLRERRRDGIAPVGAASMLLGHVPLDVSFMISLTWRLRAAYPP